MTVPQVQRGTGGRCAAARCALRIACEACFSFVFGYEAPKNGNGFDHVYGWPLAAKHVSFDELQRFAGRHRLTG
jgi:hypothetical protein